MRLPTQGRQMANMEEKTCQRRLIAKMEEDGRDHRRSGHQVGR